MSFWSKLWWGPAPISKIVIKHGGKTYSLKFEPSDYTNKAVLLGTLKSKLAPLLDVPAELLKVWTTDPKKQLTNDKRTLEDYGVKNNATLLVVGEKPKPMTPADHVQAAVDKVENELGLRIKEFCANPPTTEKAREKEFLYLNEIILQNILKLDNIETDGDAELRAMRKQAINKLQKYHSEIDTANKKSLELIAAEEAKSGETTAAPAVNSGESAGAQKREGTPETQRKNKKKAKGKKR